MAPSAPAPKTSAWHKLSPGLWTLDSSIPSLPFERRMTVCQLATGGPRVTRLARSLLVSDKAKLAEHLQQLSQMPQLKRIIPGHGAIIEAQASESLSRIAHSLCPALSKKPSTPA